MVDLVHVPADPDHPDAWTVEGTVRVGEAVDLRDPRLDRLLARRPDHPRDPDRSRTARSIGSSPSPPGRRATPPSVVGRAMVGLPLVGNPHLAVVYVGVHPDWRRQGIGSALCATPACDLARAAGRRVVISDSVVSPTEPPAGPGALESPTGSGRIPDRRRRHPVRARPRLHARAGGPALGAGPAVPRPCRPPAPRPRPRLPRPPDAGRVRRGVARPAWPSSRRG